MFFFEEIEFQRYSGFGPFSLVYACFLSFIDFHKVVVLGTRYRDACSKCFHNGFLLLVIFKTKFWKQMVSNCFLMFMLSFAHIGSWTLLSGLV